MSEAPGRGEALPAWQMDASLQSAMGLGEEASGAERSPWRTVQRTASPSARKQVQRRASDGASASTKSEDVAAIGARGVAGGGEALPHGEVIQRAFGRHDVSGVRAHVGGEAAAASQQLGAEAYATGSDVAFAGAPSLHTAAHEAAHVVQQRAGVHLKGGLDEPGDSHEQHADAVADAVVAGRSAEALLDRYAGGSASASGGGSGSVQRKPIKDKDADERHYHDDAHPKLKLVKEADAAEHEYRIKDRIQKVYWKDASNYFTDEAHKQPLDLKQFEATREFGAFVETFQEASAMEHAGEEGSEAASMHLLQQFYSNALFDSSEVERFDYQASPLNYQDEHTYIRAAATGSVDVLKDRLFEDALGTDLEAYLAGQMDFRDTLHQMFRAVAIEEEPDASNLAPKLGGLADGIAGHVAVRFAKKTEFEKANKEERDKVAKEHAAYKGKISNVESAIKKTKRDTLQGDDATLFDWKADKDDYLAAQNDLEKESSLASQIQDLDKQLAAQSSPQPQSASPSTPQQSASPSTSQPQSATPQPAKGKKPPKPKDDPATKKENLTKALASLQSRDSAKKSSELAGKLKLDGSFSGLTADAAAPRLEAMQLEQAKAQKGPYAQLLVQLETLKQEQAAKKTQLEQIDQRRFELMRDFDKAYGGLAFIDFTALLEGMPVKQAAAKIKEWGALATQTLLGLIEAALPKKSVAPTDVPKIMSELKKAKTLGKAFFTGGMMEVGSGKLSSPALLTEKTELAMPVKTALGKSGYVPTPTSANRQMVQGKVPLKDIVLGIIDKQLKRQPISPETSAKLTQLRQTIAAFDASKHQRVADAPANLAGAQEAYAAFAKLATHKDEHVTLMVRPVVQLFGKLDILSAESLLPPFALRQLEGHLRDAVADAGDVAALQRSVQNLHEFVIYHLELSDGAAPGAEALQLPDGAQDPHITHYGLNAFSHAFEGVLKQQAEDGGAKLEVAALDNIYFEMMQKLGYTQGASGGAIGLSHPSSAAELIKGLKPTPDSSGVTAKAVAPDMIVIDIHPNDAAKTEIHQNDVVAMLHQLFGAAPKGFRCTVLVDVTLNHITEDEVVNIRNEARAYIDSGQLNLVFNQSLTKFAQFGTDKHSGGLMFHFNDGTHWQAFNQHVSECVAKDHVDPTIQKYFMALFQHTERENHEYLRKVRRNSRYVYEKLREQFATIKCQEVLSLAENDDPRTCYVAFNYKPFVAKLLGPTADENLVKQMAHDILYGCINELAGMLELPLNMRTSFGFPLSNFGDIDPGIRLTVGIESRELLDRYVQILTFTNGALGRQAESDASKLTDVAARRQFLAEITQTVTTLEKLDEQIQAMQGGKGAQQTALPMGSQPASLAKAPTGGSGSQTSTTSAVSSTLLYGEKIDVGINAVPNIGNSCYISALLNLFASSAAYRDMIAQNRPPQQLPDAPVVPPSQVQVLCTRLHDAVTALRTQGAEVTDAMIRDVRDSLRALGWLQAPDVVLPKKQATPTPTVAPTVASGTPSNGTPSQATPSVDPTLKSGTPTPSTPSVDPTPKSVDPTPKSVDPSGASATPVQATPSPSLPTPSSEKALVAQQDAAEILQKLLGALTVPATMQVGEQGRKKQADDADFVDHLARFDTGMIQLPISAPDVHTLEQALRKYCTAEQVEQWGEKLITFRALPRTLTIALKRFDYLNYHAAKNLRRIAVPTEFVMPNDCLHPSLHGQQFRYKVVSSVEHIGAYGGGHYVAHGRRDAGGGYLNDDQQDGTRAESEQELNENLANSYLYVFEQVIQ